MSKIRLVALFAVLMLVLSACANGGGAQETPGVGTPGLVGTPGAMETPLGTAEGGVPVTGETPMVTEGEATGAATTEVTTTEAATTEPPATEAATTEPAETGSPEVEDGTGTPGAGGVPVTGAGGLEDAYPNTVSEVSNYVIVDQDCEQVASIDGHLVSVGDGQILYLVASPTGPLEVDGRLLIPWNALDVNLEAAAAGGSEGMSQQTPGAGGLETPGTGGIAQTPGGLGTPEGAATEMLGGTGTPEAGGTPGADGQAGACAVFDEGQAFMLNVGVDQVS
ncbi:MAG TPA: hypothetical protein VFF68_10715, partial [Anaerolineaceae bacterium]|nr:hypothetical protein [Anaerolineaceae bacterium]